MPESDAFCEGDRANLDGRESSPLALVLAIIVIDRQRSYVGVLATCEFCAQHKFPSEMKVEI